MDVWHVWIALLVGAVLVLYALDLGENELQPKITLSADHIRPGEFFLLQVDPLASDLSLQIACPFLDEEPRFFRYGQGVVALIPVDYRTRPGDYGLEAEIVRGGQIVHRLEQGVTVSARDFAIQKLYVFAELLSHRDETMWAEDRVHTDAARARSNSDPLWEGLFQPALTGRITTQFGQIRLINDQESGRHSGLDIAAPRGTEVAASNNGEVVLARFLHVTGNTVILDHGWNLFSSYSHLDRIEVRVGQAVVKDQTIGTVGSTGFSTGPHLHWAVSIGTTFVDPEFVLGEALPWSSWMEHEDVAQR
jgi:murein DD-endopeptidase MepM/ murein hydrolase activator NlpD